MLSHSAFVIVIKHPGIVKLQSATFSPQFPLASIPRLVADFQPISVRLGTMREAIQAPRVMEAPTPPEASLLLCGKNRTAEKQRTQRHLFVSTLFQEREQITQLFACQLLE